MITFADLLNDVRIDMRDANAATPRWSDADIYLVVKDGIRDYSLWFPKRVDRLEIASVTGKFPLPSDFIEDIHVESPIDTYLEKQRRRPGVRYRASSRPMYYYIQGGSLYLSNPPLDGDTIFLTYSALHGVPISEKDTTFELTVPEVDIEVIRLYAKGRLYARLRGGQSSLDRFKQTGKRDDNPLVPEVDDTMADYYRAIAVRYRGGDVKLYRSGRMK
ncbi:MAG: hypothetical protein KQI81_08965 [Deltaproteobacteria bacterium]|nr:hypothetical protein [Deltaproteobacteria bacterium]